MSKEVTKFLKKREVKSPSRAFQNDAGIDFYVPKFTKEFIEDLKKKNENLFPKNNCGNELTVTTISLHGAPIQGCYQPGVDYKLNDINNTQFKFDDERGELYFILPPHNRVLIPSGIYLKMAKPDRALIATNKSGVASKLGLVVGATTVDYSYQGEIHLNVINTSTSNVRIYENMKIIQFIETPIITNEIEIVENTGELSVVEFYNGFESQRKDKGFGSTTNK